MVPHIRVELMIFCVRGRCPGPLDECGICWTISLSKSGAKVHIFLILTKYFFKKSYIGLFFNDKNLHITFYPLSKKALPYP